MKFIKCDRCGRDTKGMHILFQGTLLIPIGTGKSGRGIYKWGEDKDIDLCNDCRAELVILLSDWFTN
jgi:hypothetical protein